MFRKSTVVFKHKGPFTPSALIFGRVDASAICLPPISSPIC